MSDQVQPQSHTHLLVVKPLENPDPEILAAHGEGVAGTEPRPGPGPGPKSASSSRALPRISPSSPLLMVEGVQPPRSGASVAGSFGRPLSAASALNAPPSNAIPIVPIPSGPLLTIQPTPGAAVIPPLSESQPMLVIKEETTSAPDVEQIRAISTRLQAAAAEALAMAGLSQSPAATAVQKGRVLWYTPEQGITLVAAWRMLREPASAIPVEAAAKALTLLLLYITHTMKEPVTLTGSALASIQESLGKLGKPLSLLLKMMQSVEARLSANPQPETGKEGEPASPDPTKAQAAPPKTESATPPTTTTRRRRSQGIAIASGICSGIGVLGMAIFWGMELMPQATTLNPATFAGELSVKQARYGEGSLELVVSDENFDKLQPTEQYKKVADMLASLGKKVHTGTLKTPKGRYLFQVLDGQLLLAPEPVRPTQPPPPVPMK